MEGFWWKRRNEYFLNLDFSVAVSFLNSVGESKSVLLKIKIVLALVRYRISSAFGIWFRLSIIRRSVSVPFVRDLSWFGKAGWSISWIVASSKLKVPSWTVEVVNSIGEILVSRLESILNIVDFPVFGKPAKTTCMSAFLIPS